MPLIPNVVDAAKRFLAEPATAGMDVDAAETSMRRRSLIESKRFLKRIYDEWYAMIATALPPTGGRVLEIGSGGGFLASSHPDVITSDVLPLSDLDVVFDAARLPFKDGSLRAVVMTNVLHHVPDVRMFFSEVIRCMSPGGCLVMIEPWATPWSRWVYGLLHHEPFDANATDWIVPGGKPLSAANGALPWIIFSRDHRQFEDHFPHLELVSIRPMMPLRYLISGGVSSRALAPAWSFRLWAWIDHALEKTFPGTAMFAHIVVRRVNHAPARITLEP